MIVHTIKLFALTVEHTDKLYSLLSDFARQQLSLSIALLPDSVKSSEVIAVLQKATDSMIEEIRRVDTKYKRQKQCVAPEEMALGLKWATKPNPHIDVPIHIQTQTTFQYVPITKTLATIFQQDELKSMYLEYNENGHRCVPEIYANYCCAANFKNSELFRQYPNAIQLQLSIDDVELCSALKSKKKIHKMCAIYMQIRNVPPKFLSKLSSIYVVALCETENLKQEDTSLDNILELIVRDINSLQKEGIDIGLAEKLRAIIVNFSFDKLGGNALFGFKENFSSSYYCRMCTGKKEDCQHWCAEQPSRMRNIPQYNEAIELIQQTDAEPDLDKTMGIKKYCLLNDIENYHIISNRSVDLMHDINEGLIPVVLQALFNHCVEKKIISSRDLICRVRDFNYGFLSKSNKPSTLDITKRNLGHNASQLHCLMVNLPFILTAFREELRNVWHCIESVLKVMQVIYSDVIPEADVVFLEREITTCLESIKETFKMKLTPKMHLSTHYPNSIRTMGPVRHSWMMRSEAKHKLFTTWAKRANNFTNVCQTLAKKHQEQAIDVGLTYADTIEMAKQKKSAAFLRDRLMGTMLNMNKAQVIQFFSWNGLHYRNGLFVCSNSEIYEIQHIVSDGKHFCFVANHFLPVKYDSFL